MEISPARLAPAADLFFDSAIAACEARARGRLREAKFYERESAALARAAANSAAPDRGAFARDVARRMAVASLEGRDTSLYRAFDAFDLALGLDYAEEDGMNADLAIDERLYEGAGAGVQTSYASIFRALDALALPRGACLVDLGAGYGRVGLSLALVRPDARTIGYEYVGHRVRAANRAAASAGVDGRARFYKQDLHDTAFEMPEADAYYMYDPFTPETYGRVFAKIREQAAARSIAVAVKGNGAARFEAEFAKDGWRPPIACDEGTMRIFRSR